MLSTKISYVVGASLGLHCGTVTSAESAGRVRGVVSDGPFSVVPVPPELAAEALTEIADRGVVEVMIDKAGRRHCRDRSLPAWVVVYVVFGWCLFTGQGYAALLRDIWPSLCRLRGRQVPLPHASAVPKARMRVGPQPFTLLFDQVRGPLAGPRTPGAFAFGRRLVAIDGTVLDVRDSTDNDAVFDRLASSHGPGPRPQVRLTLLFECATHAILAGRFDGVQTSEHVHADALIGDLQPDMLLLADRNFHSFHRWHAAAATGADLLWRVRTGSGRGVPRLPIITVLPDGSFLSRLRESQPARRQRSDRTGAGTTLLDRMPEIIVRVIDYTILVTTTDEHGHPHTRHETVRLLTTILDPTQATAHDLATSYHERWEAETGYGHLKTRLRGPRTALRSQHPNGIHQEICAHLCVYQTLCRIAATAAHHAGIDPDRISFTVTLRALRRSITNPTDHPPTHTITNILTLTLNPRRNRTSDRNRKPPGRKRRTHNATYTIKINPPPTPNP